MEGVVNGVQERQNVWESVEEEIEGRIAETLSAVERIERRTSAVKDHEEKLNGVKKLMDVYVNLLGEEAKYQGIAEKIEQAVKTVSEKMAVVQKGTAAVLPKAKKVKAVKAVQQELLQVIPQEPLKKAAMPPPPKAADIQFSNEWLRLAYEILMEHGGEMNYGDLTKEALARGLVTKVQCASDAMYNRIKNSITKGEGLFKKTGVGMFALV